MSIDRPVAFLIAFMALACSLGAGASASEALHVGRQGGFLLGHASRCGVPDKDLEQPAKLIHELISGAADSPEERALVDQALAEQFILSTVRPSGGGLLPSCPRVRREFARLAQHQAPKPNPGMPADVERTLAHSASLQVSNLTERTFFLNSATKYIPATSALSVIVYSNAVIQKGCPVSCCSG